MALKPFRCHNERCSEYPDKRLIYDFWAEQPVCPKCKTDGRNPRYVDVVIRLSIIHYDPPSHVKGRGMGWPACEPKSSWRKGMTGAPHAVNCPRCRATAAWKKAAEADDGDVLPEHDCELEVAEVTDQGRTVRVLRKAGAE